jgi:hypothetical protein
MQHLIEGNVPAVDQDDSNFFLGESKIEHDLAAIGTFGALLLDDFEAVVPERRKQFDSVFHSILLTLIF